MTLLSQTVMARCDALARITETPGAITRTYLTECHAKANRLVAGWMEEAGMAVHVDAAGSIVGRYEADRPDASAVILGSHLDTVRNAGRYDGILGVLLAIAVVDRLRQAGRRLPFAVEVYGFGEEEGVRFGTSLIGSHALAGHADPAWLDIADEAGVTLGRALADFGLEPARLETAARSPEKLRAYLEVHIEQGPVLEALDLPVGVVTAICGATRRRYRIDGLAGHAGTVPMDHRRDALAGACEMVLAIEAAARAHGVVATVGRLAPQPDAVNVIPGGAVFTLDLRAERDADRLAALTAVDREIAAIALSRRLDWSVETFHQAGSVPCDPALQARFAEAIAAQGLAVHRLASGAGHDAMAVAALAPVAMLFVRCRAGLSHHPDEAVEGGDVETAGLVLADMLDRLAAPS